MEIGMDKKKTNLCRFRLAGVLAALLLAGVLGGCADSGQDADTPLAGLNTDSYIKVGDYSAFAVTVSPKKEVAQEDIDAYIQYVLAKYPVTDDAAYTVASGDTVNIDFTGKRDGVAFDGGTGTGYDLKIGSGTFIPGFEDGLIGAKIGETRDLALTFPDDYTPELAGADVIFTVKINHTYAAQMTDKIAAALNPDAPTVEKYREYAKGLLEKDAQLSYESAVGQEITKQLLADSKIKKDAPEKLVDRYFKQQVDYLTQLARFNYNVDYETLIQSTGSTVEAYEETIRKNAQEYANQMVLYQAIANAEGMAVTEEEIKAEAARNVAAGSYESEDAFLESAGKEEVRDYLMRNKVVQFLTERASVTEAETQETENLQEAADVLNKAAGK